MLHQQGLDDLHFDQRASYSEHALAREWFQHPPKLPTQEEVDVFAESLRDDVIPAKIKQLVERAEFLIQQRKDGLSKVERDVESGKFKNDRDPEFSQYFWTYLVNTQYEEFFHIQRWLKYFFKLVEMATKTPVMVQRPVREDDLTEERIAKAKEYPLTELYDGELRHTFGKLMGNCPFHEEKTPSFVIFENDNHFYCFGCHVWGDAIDFYMKTHNTNLADAVKALENG